MRILRLLGGCAAIGCLALSACRDHAVTAGDDFASTGLGNASRANMAVQTVDPWPRHARNTRARTDGQRALMAFDRYRTNADRAKPPTAESAGDGEDDPAPPPKNPAE